jgi:hypothetical protein
MLTIVLVMGGGDGFRISPPGVSAILGAAHGQVERSTLV